MIFKKYHALIVAVCSSAAVYSQNVGIGITTPFAGLEVARGTGPFGTAAFRGTTYISHFNYSTTEDTYIRGGKPTSNVIINDVGTNVGIGVNDPSFKLDVGNRMRLRSQGTDGITAGIWFNNYDNSDLAGFVGEPGPGAPNHIGMYGLNSGWSLVMNTVSGNVGINTFNTTAGNSNAKLNITGTNIGHAIKLYGNGQFISFFDAGNNYKGYIWNNGNSIEISTDVTNASGEVNLKAKGVQGLSVQSDGRVRVGILGCSIPVNGVAPVVTPKFSVFGHLGFKKTFGDQAGEWALAYIPSDFLGFHFNGGLKSWIRDDDGSWNTTSDSRLKENLEGYKLVLDGIKKLNVLTYHYKADKTGKRSFGLIAQNVQQYFPEIVSLSGGPDNLLGMDYSKIGVLAIKGIQEQQSIIEEQNKKIEMLLEEIRQIKEKLK